MRTPPNVSPEVFSVALQAFAGVVGKEWVFVEDEDLFPYRDSYSPLRDTPEDRSASAAVAPGSVEEVQAVVRIADKHRIPLYTISTGKNLGYGGSAPNHGGSVVLDLKRMNRIIEVNESNGYAIVEPGVSYFDLYNYIQERGLKVWLDVADPGWGSVVGNALDHGVGHTLSRFRNHFDSHCGMEVVLANGEMVRTGMGALPGSQTWGQFKMGMGPILDGIFSQSNFGVVTKMGIWLMPAPEAFMHGMVMAARYDDLHAVVELLKYVENTGLASGAPEMSSPLLGISNYTKHLVDAFYEGPPQLQKQHADLIAKASVGYSAELQKYGLDNNIPYWVLNLKFYGPPKVIQAQWEAVQELAEKSIKGVRFQAGQIQSDPRKASAEWTVYPQDVGVPNMDFFGMGTRAGGNPHPMRGHMWFSPVIPQTAQGILEANRVFEEAYRTLPALQNVPIWNLRPFALPAPFFERAFLFIVGFPITDDASMNKASIKAYRTLLDIGAQHGWGEYRCHPEFQDQAMGLYSYNNNSLLRLNEVIKDAIDPNGILSPGRYGIWPRHLRKGAQ
ncbi:FAD-binding oxidoreductase [Pseudomonas hefeiensis]|uniref:FAD-binding oxidoreductase n=1 Tax=Pseudomonas hefeiensis TaxID=2738125 RepID=A0ABY9G5F0_9PSED|nr:MULTISPECIES: FAD-binding oxidoreductase [unclassified Pseudomonas]WLH10845.1 FAD-binding oxidoreductase [Pseudomonas sp. FP205]WLH93927.1 FAD-binding oxidoreductase [Pseudomonas sp. FP53]WLI38201.1 FAD-binding oxidoreductase [Pseudomonas sp. FP821]